MTYALDIYVPEINWRKSVSGWAGDHAVDVKSPPYNAAGDGVTDDTAAFTAALATGLNVYVPAGTYLISSQLTVNGQALFGDGPLAILRAASASFNMVNLAGVGCRVYGLYFQGAATDASTGQFAIQTSTSSVPSDFSIHDCKFGGSDASHTLNNGVYIQGNGEANFRISDNYFENLIGTTSGHGYGVLMGLGFDGVVSNNNFVGTRGTHGRHAVYCSAGASRIEVIGNTITNFNYEGISVFSQGVQPPCANISIIGNDLYGCGADTVSDGSIAAAGILRNILIANNQVTASYGNGIHAESTSANFKSVVIEGNVVYQPNYNGIIVLGVQYVNVSDNYVYGASQKTAQTYYDIEIAPSSNDSTPPLEVLVSGNKCTAQAAVSRCPFYVVASMAGTVVKVYGNDFPSTNYFTGPIYNNDTTRVWINGRLQYTQTGYDPPNVAAGATYTLGGISIPGADQGDICTAGFTTDLGGGIVLTAQCYSTGFVQVLFSNVSAAAINLASGTLRVDVWKRDGYGL